jgi:hypothetical protein
VKRLCQGKRDFWNEWNFDEAVAQNSSACFTQPPWGDDRYSGTSTEMAETSSTTEFAMNSVMPNLLASAKEGVLVGERGDTVQHLAPRATHLAPVQELD